MTFPFGQEITVVRRTRAQPDALGNDTWTSQETVVQGAYNPGSSFELVQGQDLLTVQPTVYLPAGTPIAASDRVKVDGLTYEVDGSPREWRSPFSAWQPGVEIKLKRVTG